MKALEFNMKLNDLKIGLFSDIHGDSPDCDTQQLKIDLKKATNAGRYLLFGGDTFDAITHGDKKRYTPSRAKNNRDDELNAKVEYIAEILLPFAKQILFIGRGNHEDSVLKHNGVDLLELLIKYLAQPIAKGNYQNLLRFKFGNKNYDILQHHGAGGSAPITKGMIDFNRISQGADFDLLWIGHKHNAIVDYSIPMMSLYGRNTVLKNRAAIMTPSYQKGRTIDYNVNFAERFYSHTAMSGYGQLDLSIYEDPRISLAIKQRANIGKIQKGR